MRKWLQPLVDEYLQAVAPLQHSKDDRAQAITWANWMRQHWAQHGLSDLKQQRNLMTDLECCEFLYSLFHLRLRA
jgi:hypothetical protein